MKTSDFDYELPPDLIAQHPAPERTQARMLVVDRKAGAFEHRRVMDLPACLKTGDLLVVNDTKVVPSRLFGRKELTAGKAEALFVEEKEAGIWDAFLRVSGRIRIGLRLLFASGRLRAEVLSHEGRGRVCLRVESGESVMDILEQEGLPPLPPYIKRSASGEVEEAALTALRSEDKERYQTVYARVPGAVAAPTAGLHFTPELLQQLKAMGVEKTAITLHVGPGTFKPVTVETVEDHRIEPERFAVPAETALLVNRARERGGRIVAVGSTVVRTLEAVALEKGGLCAAEGRSGLFIYPPFTFRVVDVLLTNFHLPASTLLMMVCAFAGRDLAMEAYREAVRQRYRFYSYGDCMLIV